MMHTMGEDALPDGASVSARGGFDAAGREYPYFDEQISGMVIKHSGDWLVSVSPMLFNVI